MRYAVARYNDSQRDMAYRFYVTEGLRMTTETLAKHCGGNYMPCKFVDLLNPEEKDSRTGDEIAFDVIRKAGLEVDLSEFI